MLLIIYRSIISGFTELCCDSATVPVNLAPSKHLVRLRKLSMYRLDPVEPKSIVVAIMHSLSYESSYDLGCGVWDLGLLYKVS